MLGLSIYILPLREEAVDFYNSHRNLVGGDYDE